MKIPFALKDGILVDVTQVDKGKNCMCLCPNCKQPLIAAKGENKIHHFKHDKNVKENHCYESVLHIVAKEIFQKYRNTALPPVYLERKDEYGKKIKFIGKQEIFYSHVILEKSLGDIIPDILLITEDSRHFLIEIAVTNKVNQEKFKSIISNDISTIEIDLSSLYNKIKAKIHILSLNQFEYYIIKEINNRKWLYSRERNNFLNYMVDNYCQIKIPEELIYEEPPVYIEETKSYEKDYDFLPRVGYRVLDCPIKKGIFKLGKKCGQSYADVKKHCSKCVYCAKIDYLESKNKRTEFNMNRPTKVFCIYQPHHLFSSLIYDFTNEIKTIHGNKKYIPVSINNKQTNSQLNLFD